MPAISSTFRSGEPALSDLLRDVQQGKVQLPDFQRGWVWDDGHIRSLIASVSLFDCQVGPGGGEVSERFRAWPPGEFVRSGW